MNSVPLTSAFIAGLISFLSPCVLPLVPGYISMISGTGVDELRAGDQKLMGRVLFQSAMFILGFSIVFIAFGASATAIGQFTRTYRYLLAPIAGAVIMLFGLHLTGILKIKALYADKRLHNAGKGSSALGAFVIGFAFAFGWTPCIGPILGAILTFAAAQDTVMKGVILLTVYSAGLAVPFLLTSLGVERFLAFYSRFRRHLHAVEVTSGVLLIVIGALIMTRHFTLLSGYLSFLNRFAM
jgi:cytochrome c-type biogenesis protein